MSHDPLHNVAASRPDAASPSSRQTSTARRSLVEHIAAEQGTALTGASAERATIEHAGDERSRWRTKVTSGRLPVVMAAAAAVLVLIALVVRPDSGEPVNVETADTADEAAFAAAPETAGASSVEGAVGDLDGLVARLRALDDVDGDATIVRREHSGGGTVRIGIDVYFDDGRFGYLSTMEATRGSEFGDRAWPAAIADSVAAMEAVASTESGMVVGLFGDELSFDQQVDAGASLSRFAWRAVLQGMPATASSLDARIGAARVLSELDAVTVTSEPSDDGGPTLAIEFRDGDVVEMLTISAETGLPLRYERLGADGELIAAVTSAISRVDSSDVFD